ncbi:MAG: YihA family ribosome biogenesis GTP-binding protein [Bacteroidales bacterium]|nr:YihA family ribosome biogenesis GTP-binding protein [Bacteroidales bacterium]
MIIKSATFVKSSPSLKECPKTTLPEFAFIGRSNVGKSSLINMITRFDKLAKTSGEPGKTQAINHFLINEQWYLVDLPGYGYAKVPQKLRDKWIASMRNYIIKRDNLVYVFVLLDSRLKPQQSDIEFMEFLGINQIPFVRVFTKIDKIGRDALTESIRKYDEKMFETWEEMPITFTTSASKGLGRDEILNFIEANI